MIWRWGSSPHTRGALVSASGSGNKDGIIPAYAGSTRIRRRELVLKRDHPRIRGEHMVGVYPARSELGSSPHTRGARCYRYQLDFTAGIIPAYAGSTLSVAMASRSYRDHPRIRGEHMTTTPLLMPL